MWNRCWPILRASLISCFTLISLSSSLSSYLTRNREPLFSLIIASLSLVLTCLFCSAGVYLTFVSGKLCGATVHLGWVLGQASDGSFSHVMGRRHVQAWLVRVVPPFWMWRAAIRVCIILSLRQCAVLEFPLFLIVAASCALLLSAW